MSVYSFFFQAEDGIRDLVRSRGLGDVYKRQDLRRLLRDRGFRIHIDRNAARLLRFRNLADEVHICLLYTSDAADERSSVDLGGRRIIKKKKIEVQTSRLLHICETIPSPNIQHHFDMTLLPDTTGL